MMKSIIRCTCREDKNLCPLHGKNKGNRRVICESLLIRYPRTIKSGNEEVENKRLDVTWKNLSWSDEELKAMSKEKLWSVACILQLPHKQPSLNESTLQRIDILRHIKAALGMYSEETINEVYFTSYPEMRGIIETYRGTNRG